MTSDRKTTVAIIGGGAAGVFAAINIKENYPNAAVTIFEKSENLLTKVRVSGGGRCNLTNACPDIKEFSKAYSRGEKFLRKALHIFNNGDTVHWFRARGVPFMTEPDGRTFPRSQKSETIIDCFLGEMKKLGIEPELCRGVRNICLVGNQLELDFENEKFPARIFDKVIVATGGSPKQEGLEWLEELGHKVESPVPSIFTFNMPNESIRELQGVVVKNTLVKIEGTRLKAEGSLLVTHWGMSGPVILKLSALGARELSKKDYKFSVQINWVNEQSNEVVGDILQSIANDYPQKMLSKIRPYNLPERLWDYLVVRCDLAKDKRWGELSKKGINRLANLLTNDIYSAEGKTSFRGEFVTCGGVSLDSIDSKTMKSKVCKNLYFAGEIMDIDGITGGYNLQAAWTTGFIAAQLN